MLLLEAGAGREGKEECSNGEGRTREPKKRNSAPSVV